MTGDLGAGAAVEIQDLDAEAGWVDENVDERLETDVLDLGLERFDLGRAVAVDEAVGDVG